MADPVSITVAMIVAYAAPKLLDAALSKVGESLTEGALAKAKQTGEKLRQAILGRFQPEQQAAIVQSLQAADESLEQRQHLESWLTARMAEDPQFAEELRRLALEIDQVIRPEAVPARNVQQNIGAPGIQLNDSSGAVSQTINYNNYGKD